MYLYPNTDFYSLMFKRYVQGFRAVKQDYQLWICLWHETFSVCTGSKCVSAFSFSFPDSWYYLLATSRWEDVKPISTVQWENRQQPAENKTVSLCLRKATNLAIDRRSRHSPNSYTHTHKNYVLTTQSTCVCVYV